MVIPTTGLVFLFGTFVFLSLARRFWQCYKLENNYIAKIFSYSFFCLGLGYLILIVPCLLLIEEKTVWRIVAPIYVFFLSSGYLLLGYIVAWIKFRKYLTIILVFLSMVLIYGLIGYILQPPVYFFTDGVLDWEISQEPALSAFSFLLLLVLPATIVFFQEAIKAKEKKTKIRALGLGLSMLSLLTGGIVDMFLLTFLNIHPIYSDLNWFIMFSILAITLVLTWGPPKPKWVTKIE